jgi:hypothetical protein
MAVSASLTIPVTVTTQAQADAAASVFLSALGSSHVAVDPYASKATLAFQFPGDLDPIMRELYRRGLSHSATLAFSIGLRTESGGAGDVRDLVGRLRALPAVSNVSFDGTTLTATIAAATGAMRCVAGEIAKAGFIATDAFSRGRA